MKYVLLTLIGVAMMFNSNAQGKVLTMEDAVLGYHLYPKNLYVQWQGERNVLTSVRGNELVGQDAATGRETVLMTLAELNAALGTDLKGWPQFSWKDAGTLVVARQGKMYEIDVEKKAVAVTYTIARGAQNVTPSGYGLVAYTKGNNLYYTDANGNEFAVTADKDPNFVNGQTVSRNEFGIAGGIFWSPDGKKLGFYRKDESQVGTFPLLDITTRTGSLREIKYPMAGMKSEQVSLGIYDIASGKTVWADVTDFGREQYLTNIAWGPASDRVYIQVLDRDQKHMHLNEYCARTGAFVKTLLTEENEKYVEPLMPVVFLKGDDSKFIYRTNNRDGYFNLYPGVKRYMENAIETARKKEYVETIAKTSEGQKYTDFALDTPEGKEVKLSDYVSENKYTLVDFWASWCGPCRKEMPSVAAAYAKYKAKGFGVVGVSLDSNPESWKKGIADLKITWPQMSDLKGWQSEAARLYGVRSIPSTVLVAQDGTIVARDLRGEDIASKLAELLK